MKANKVNILILGSGAREHSLALTLKKSALCGKVYIAPGNAGTATLGTNLNFGVSDFEQLKSAIITHNINLVLPSSEQSLVDGIVDYLASQAETAAVPVIGPDKYAAQLEGSKHFSKELMLKYNIPTASSRSFNINELQEARIYINNHSLPIVLKADGLAAGKGVIIAQSHEEALYCIAEMLVNRQFGEAGDNVLIEEFLQGIEMSYFILSDGLNYVTLPEAKDYKRIGEGDTGLNTGGMGTVSPLPFCDEELRKKIEAQIIKPTLLAMNEAGHPFKGFLFIGLMIHNSEPKVIEFNVRLGDPETQSILSRLDTDFLEVLLNCAASKLDNSILPVLPLAACTIVLAANGYPNSYPKGDELTKIDNETDLFVFHAGTKQEGKKTVSNGGRVLAVTALGKDLAAAKDLAMNKAERISWQNKYYRKDIADDVIKFVS